MVVRKISRMVAIGRPIVILILLVAIVVPQKTSLEAATLPGVPLPRGDIKNASVVYKEHLADVLSGIESLKSARGKSASDLIAKTAEDFGEVEKDLVNIENKLVSGGAPAEILDRLSKFQKNYQGSVEEILSAAKNGKDIAPLLTKFSRKPEIATKIYNPESFRAKKSSGIIKKDAASYYKPAVSDAVGKLAKDVVRNVRLKTTEDPKIENQDTLLASSSSDIALAPPTESAGALAGISSVDPIYTSETEEVRFTQGIKDQAARLNYDPLEIINYVTENIEYVPYYGSKKSADATLLERAGNDFDQSSLLIALLRVGDPSGNEKTPARYREANIKLDVGRVMDWLGVEDPIVAAEIFEKTGVPYVLYVDDFGNPLFFVIEHIYAEAYVPYDWSRGILPGNQYIPYRWVPLDPSLKRSYMSQPLDAISAMSWNADGFFDEYLAGAFGTQTPLEAAKGQIQTYLAANRPDLSYEDALAKKYSSFERLEFLSATLPYEIQNQIAEFAAVPENLKHRMRYAISNPENGQMILDAQFNVASLAEKEFVLDYVGASQADRDLLATYQSIYDVVPLSLVHMKPVLKVRGEVIAGGGALDTEIGLGKGLELKIEFRAPQKEIAGVVSETVAETVSKPLTTGTAEGIALNTDRIVLPGEMPGENTSSSESTANQKLYATALRFLHRLDASHDEIGNIFGAKFANVATRAIVFNGVDVNYQDGEPYSFEWKGLRIDTSLLINYWNHFGSDSDKYQ